jgi:hypothetical protein
MWEVLLGGDSPNSFSAWTLSALPGTGCRCRLVSVPGGLKHRVLSASQLEQHDGQKNGYKGERRDEHWEGAGLSLAGSGDARAGRSSEREYDLTENHHQLTLVRDFMEREMGGVEEWAEFLLLVLSEVMRLLVGRGPTRGGHRLTCYQWDLVVC